MARWRHQKIDATPTLSGGDGVISNIARGRLGNIQQSILLDTTEGRKP